MHARGEAAFPPRPPASAEAVLAFAALERAEAQALAAADQRLATYACACRACQKERVSRGMPAVREEPEHDPEASPCAEEQPGGAAAEGDEAARARAHKHGGRASQRSWARARTRARAWRARRRSRRLPAAAAVLSWKTALLSQAARRRAAGAPLLARVARRMGRARQARYGLAGISRCAVLQARAGGFAGGHLL